MSAEYSVEVCRALEEEILAARLYRPMRIERYEAGRELAYDVTGVTTGQTAKVRLVVEDFVGGGYAGQVYRVKVAEIGSGTDTRYSMLDARKTAIDENQESKIENQEIDGLVPGGVYAMKILIPPSSFSRLFRNLLYWIGFQGPFQLQVNPAAARAGALWQKFIRRGAKIRFGSEEAVADVYATFVDENLGSCGELREWVEGRTWRLEADEYIDLLKQWLKGQEVDSPNLGSPEYRAKRVFMKSFVGLLHEMGAYELARQYEWSTCKSQPNCLKRAGSEAEPSGGLVAVDFRAGLTLLPFLPMSPGDFKLIINGLSRGSLVQFDRGDIDKLRQFVDSHSNDFADMQQALDELKAAEQVYRDSVPDITHNHVRLLSSRQLWPTIIDSAVTGWKVRGLVDNESEQSFRASKFAAVIFCLLGAVPFLGKLIRRLWARPDWRRHYLEFLGNWDYFKRSVHAKIIERIIVWHRAGRVGSQRALKLQEQLLRFLFHLPLSILPAGLHRFLTDRQYAKEKLSYFLVRPARLYFNAQMREEWLRQMIEEGKKNNMLTDEDAEVILSQINEPFIQKYLKSLAVHVCTLPVTQLVSVTIAIIYVLLHPEMPRTQAWATGVGIIALFQVVPISPGSLARGLYVLYLVLRERNFKDYNIAVFLSFFKYIGYLAFPIQMSYHYPALARFMSAHWATGAIHIVPVFGERGALLEHGVFNLFYNRPLTIRRRIRERAEKRAGMPERFWHVGIAAIGGAVILGIANFAYLRFTGRLPELSEIWWLAAAVPMACGVAVSMGCGGASLKKRFMWAAVCGVGLGVIYTAASLVPGGIGQEGFGQIAADCVWRVFVFGILSTVAAVVTEMRLS